MNQEYYPTYLTLPLNPASSPYLTYPIVNNISQITNFCCSPKCLKPLTPKDIKGHIKYHSDNSISAEIETIEDTLDHCKNKLSGIRSKLFNEQAKFNEVLKEANPQKGDILLQKIAQSKEKLTQIIEAYYHKLQEQVLLTYASIKIDHQIIDITDQIGKNIESNLIMVAKIEAGFTDPDHFNDALKLTHQANFVKDIAIISKDNDNLLSNIQSKFLDVNLDEKLLNDFNGDLCKYINLSVKTPNHRGDYDRSSSLIDIGNHSESKNESDRSSLVIKNPLKRHSERRDSARDNKKNKKRISSNFEEKKSISFMFEFNNSGYIDTPLNLTSNSKYNNAQFPKNNTKDLTYSGKFIIKLILKLTIINT